MHRRPLFESPVPEAGWTLPVVATDDPTGIVHIQADQRGGVLDRLAVGHQRKHLPASRFDQVRCLSGALTQLGPGEVRMKEEFTSHTAA